jgi:hypothetical protein
MALERLYALATTSIPDPDRMVVRRRREAGRVRGEGYRVDAVTMTLKYLYALATPDIPNTYRAVVRRRREAG